MEGSAQPRCWHRCADRGNRRIYRRSSTARIVVSSTLWSDRAGALIGTSWLLCSCFTSLLTRGKDVIQMLALRGTVAVPILLLCGLGTDGHAHSQSQDAPRPDAGAILARLRETYRNLRSYQFERMVLVQQAGSDGKLTKIAELTLTTATENATPRPDGQMFSPINV